MRTIEKHCKFETRGSVTIGGLRLGDLGLLWVNAEIAEPETKTNIISVQTQNGNVDLTNALINYAVFENRTIQLEFILLDRDMREWQAVDSKLKNYCHGKIMDIVLDTDMGHYWRGRCSVSSSKEDWVHSKFIISVDAAPYKYDVVSTAGDWLWDTLDMVDGHINEMGSLSVDGTLEVVLIGSALRAVPEIIASAPMSVEYQGKLYELKSGSSKIYDIYIGPGEHRLKFTGSGVVTIDYRGGSL